MDETEWTNPERVGRGNRKGSFECVVRFWGNPRVNWPDTTDTEHEARDEPIRISSFLSRIFLLICGTGRNFLSTVSVISLQDDVFSFKVKC